MCAYRLSEKKLNYWKDVNVSSNQVISFWFHSVFVVVIVVVDVFFFSCFYVVVVVFEF